VDRLVFGGQQLLLTKRKALGVVVARRPGFGAAPLPGEIRIFGRVLSRRGGWAAGGEKEAHEQNRCSGQLRLPDRFYLKARRDGRCVLSAICAIA
jgi:hypothetical protein